MSLAPLVKKSTRKERNKRTAPAPAARLVFGFDSDARPVLSPDYRPRPSRLPDLAGCMRLWNRIFHATWHTFDLQALARELDVPAAMLGAPTKEPHA